jgi:hypothetical protein
MLSEGGHSVAEMMLAASNILSTLLLTSEGEMMILTTNIVRTTARHGMPK